MADVNASGLAQRPQVSVLRRPRRSANSRSLSSPGRTRFGLGLRFLPGLLILAYLNFTVFLFAYGPWPFPVVDGTKLYGFLILAHIAFLLGYVSSVGHRPKGYSGRWKLEHLIVVSLFLNLALLLPTSALRTGNLIPDVAGGLENPGAAYLASGVMRREGGGGLAEYLRILFGPLLVVLFPLTIFYWQRLKGWVRGLSVLAIAGFLAIYISIGTNKALADFVILTPCLIAASYLAGALRLSWRSKVLIAGVSLLAFSVFVAFFTTAIVSRVRSVAGVSVFSRLGITADSDNFLLQLLPEEARTSAIALSSYLTQGYYGLYLSLDEPFVPTFGVGNSFFLARNAARITGIAELEDASYPMRLTRAGKWDGLGNWSSIYPWIASDVSFPGALFVVFLIGRYFALAWLDTLKGENPFGVAAFAQFLIMLFYFSGNNQLLQSGESATGFVGVLILWLITRQSTKTGKA